MTTLQGTRAAGGSRFIDILGIRRGEGKPIGLMTLLYFVISASFVLVQTSAFSLFVEQYGPSSLPFAYLSIAVLSSLVAFLYLKFSERVPFQTAQYANLAFLVVVCLVFWRGLRSDWAPWFVFLLPFWFQTLANLANLVVWHLAGHLFNVRQAKRLYGLIGAGNWVANIVGGVLVASALAVVGPADLYLLAAVALALSVLVLRPAMRQPHASAGAPAQRPTPSGRTRSPFRHPYVRLIFGYTLVWWIAFVFIDNIFFDRAALQIPSSEGLATFLGQQLAVMGIIALITTSFLTSRIAAKYGLLVGLLIMPASVIVPAALLGLGGRLGWSDSALFWIAAAAKTLNVALGFSISQAMGTLLFQPLLGGLRSAAQTISEGIMQPIAFGTAGLMLLLLNTTLHLDAVGLSYVFVAIGVLWCGLIVVLARQYPLIMSEALLKRRLGESTTLLFDPSAVSQLRKSLSHPRPGLALYALNQLEQIAPREWPSIFMEELPSLLTHPAVEVRHRALHRAHSLQNPQTAPILRARLEEEQSPQVVAMLIQVLAALGDADSERRVLEALDSPDRRLRQAAIIGLLRSPGIPHGAQAAQALVALANSQNPEDRTMAASVVSEARPESAMELLPRLISDPSPAVRHAAIRAAGQLGDIPLLPYVLAACDLADSAYQAERVLVSRAAETVSIIETELQRSDSWAIPRGRLRSMIRVLGRISDRRCTGLLLALIGIPDSELRLQVYLSLSRLGFRSTSGERVLEQVQAEISLAAWLAGAIHALNEDASRLDLSILERALEIAFVGARGRILLLLSFVYDSRAMLRAYGALEDGATRHSPLALETVDALLPARAKPMVLPLIEDLSHGERLLRWRSVGAAAPPADLTQVLEQLIEGRPENLYAPWTRLCAIYAAAVLRKRGCSRAIQGLTEDPDVSVRDMSRWGLARLSPGTEQGVATMLSLVEKVLILKAAPIFEETPDNVLADIAGMVEELDFDREDVIFNKGDRGDSLYVIVSGAVKVWDGNRLLNELGEGEVFGELALLDPEPRLATIRAEEPTHVLRLDESRFREVLASQPEVSSGIIRVITRYLRSQLQYAREASDRIRALESFGPL